LYRVFVVARRDLKGSGGFPEGCEEMTRKDALGMIREIAKGAIWSVRWIWFVLGWAWVGCALLVAALKPDLGISSDVSTAALVVLVFSQGGFWVLYLREMWLRQRGVPWGWKKQ
jgi:hypothetical protein